MRSFLLCTAALLAAHAQAAPGQDCAELAQSFSDDVRAMDATSLAHLRTCTTGKAWSVAPAQKPSEITPPQDLYARAVLPLLSKPCKELADRVALKGLKPLTANQRKHYRGCVDGAISVISSGDRPANTATMPRAQKT